MNKALKYVGGRISEVYFAPYLSHTFYVDSENGRPLIPSGIEGASQPDGHQIPYREFDECLERIESEIADSVTEGGNRSQFKYKVRCNPGEYDIALNIPICSSIVLDLRGCKLINTITMSAVSTDFDPTDKNIRIEIIGGEITGNITFTVDSDMQLFVKFVDCQISSTIDCNSEHVDIFFDTSTLLAGGVLDCSAPTYAYLRARNSEFAGNVIGKISLTAIHSCNFAYLDTTSTNSFYVANTNFTGTFNVTCPSFAIDPISYASILEISPIPDLTGITFDFISTTDGILNMSNISAQTLTDALNIIKISIDDLYSGGTASESPIEAIEDMVAGSYVNEFIDGGVNKIRLADNRYADRYASGFIKSTITAGDSTPVFKNVGSINPFLNDLIIQDEYYLGQSGAIVRDPPPQPPTAAISQYIGRSLSLTDIENNIEPAIVYADFLF